MSAVREMMNILTVCKEFSCYTHVQNTHSSVWLFTGADKSTQLWWEITMCKLLFWVTQNGGFNPDVLQTARSPVIRQDISQRVLKRRIEFHHPVAEEGLWLGSAQLSENPLQCSTTSMHPWTSRNASQIAGWKTTVASGWSFKAQRYFVLGLSGGFWY